MVEYVEANRFFENYRGPADDFFGSVMSNPEIYPIYWSPAQMQARQDPRMAAVQSFLNARWTSESEGRRWFDPDRDTMYPDRIRRRPPGATSGGLGAHLDPGCLDLWMTEGYQRHFRHLFDGNVAAYDPWDAAYRTEAAQYPGSTMCSAFRTFQGWTALSEMRARPGRAAHRADPAGHGLPDAAPAARRRARRTACAGSRSTRPSRSPSAGTRCCWRR